MLLLRIIHNMIFNKFKTQQYFITNAYQPNTKAYGCRQTAFTHLNILP